MTGIFWILEFSATQWYQDVAPTQKFFFIATSIVSSCLWQHALEMSRVFYMRSDSTRRNNLPQLGFVHRSREVKNRRESCSVMSITIESILLFAHHAIREHSICVIRDQQPMIYVYFTTRRTTKTYMLYFLTPKSSFLEKRKFCPLNHIVPRTSMRRQPTSKNTV